MKKIIYCTVVFVCCIVTTSLAQQSGYIHKAFIGEYTSTNFFLRQASGMVKDSKGNFFIAAKPFSGWGSDYIMKLNSN